MQTEAYAKLGKARWAALWTGVLGTVYALWLLYAAGSQFVLMSTILFASGLPVFWWAQREHAPGRSLFTRGETLAATVLIIAAMVAVVLFVQDIVRVK